MGKPVFDITLEAAVTPEFKDACCSLFNQCGVYSFWFDSGEIAYIGMSQDLGCRMQSSFKERMLKLETASYFSVIETETRQDAFELESELIKRYRPALNRDYRIADKSDFDPSEYRWSGLRQCRKAGILAYRHLMYVVYEHDSVHAIEDIRLRNLKEASRKQYWLSLEAAFSTGSEAQE